MQTQNLENLIVHYAEWLLENGYSEQQIVERLDRVEEFFLYVAINEHCLREVNEQFMRDYYLDKLFEENLHLHGVESPLVLAAINKRQEALQNFSEFIRHEIAA